jgi:hypothetical protein
MKNAYLSKLNMYKAVEATLEDNKAIWETAVALPPVIADFKKRVSDIEKLAANQNTPIRGKTENKNVQKDE